jgi:hypothetical protein
LFVLRLTRLVRGGARGSTDRLTRLVVGFTVGNNFLFTRLVIAGVLSWFVESVLLFPHAPML